jgi:hypothetical protein
MWFDFGRLYFQVIKVNQLGAINDNRVIPVNIHSETGNIIMQGCFPMFMTGHEDIVEGNTDKTALENIFRKIYRSIL